MWYLSRSAERAAGYTAATAMKTRTAVIAVEQGFSLTGKGSTCNCAPCTFARFMEDEFIQRFE